MAESLVPAVATQLGLGFVVGFCVGFLAKKAGKLAALLVGAAFVLLQVLAYADVVTIDWSPIAAWWEQARRPEALERQWSAVRSILFANLPALAGAVPGLVVGLKKG